MALDNFIPEVWAARLLQSLHRVQVYTQPGVMNRDFQGDIREKGDTVRINWIGAVTVSDYTRNVDLSAPQALSDSQTTLLISRARSFNFQVDDLDAAQQHPKVMDAAMDEAAYALNDDADSFAAALYTDVSSATSIGSDASPITPTATSLYERLVDLCVLLDENNVPRTGRWVVLPPWAHGLLQKDDRFVKQVTPMATSVLMNGVVGQAAGFQVLVSNSVPNTSGAKYKILAGVPQAWTFAGQLRKLEAYRVERRFADAVKGLHLYGAKVVRPTALALLTANKPSS